MTRWMEAQPSSPEALEKALKGIDQARVGLIGDLCLDLYWKADMRRSELSRETPHHPLPIVEEWFQPGGAGNVAANLRALQPNALIVLGVVGRDWQSALLHQALERAGVPSDGLVESANWRTDTYIKPLRSGISDVIYEDPRLDFENYESLPVEAEEELIVRLQAAAARLDVLCVSDQKKFGCITPRVRETIIQLGEAGLKVIVDSRDRVGLYRNVIVKPNELEAARAMGLQNTDDLDALASIAEELSNRCARASIVTLGARGCFLCDDGKVTRFPARRVEPPIDICGAGDTFLSGVACALAGGSKFADALSLANLASCVVVKKIGVTGTASRAEIRALATDQSKGGSRA